MIMNKRQDFRKFPEMLYNFGIVLIRASLSYICQIKDMWFISVANLIFAVARVTQFFKVLRDKIIFWVELIILKKINE